MNTFELEKLLNGQPEALAQITEEINAALSEKGQKKLVDELASNHMRLTKLNRDKRPDAIRKIVTELAGRYGVNAKRTKGSHADNEFINGKKMKVRQLNKDTGELVAEFESIQAAHRITGVNDSSIMFCCHNADPNSPRYNQKSGYKSAGGYKWEFADKFPASVTVEHMEAAEAPEAVEAAAE